MKLFATCLLGLAIAAFAEPENMPLSVAGGGASSAASDVGHRVQGTVGQVLASRQLSALETLHSGFWPGRHAAAPLPIGKREIVLPDKIEFHVAYPNPFNSTTRLSFSLPQTADVRVTLFDVTGREVATLADEKFQAGTTAVLWNAESFASGTYFARMQAAGFTHTKKLVLLK